MGKLAKIGLIFCLLLLAGFRAFFPAQVLYLSSSDQPQVSSQTPQSKAATVSASPNVAAEERDPVEVCPDLLPYGATPFVFNGLSVAVSLATGSMIPVGKRAGPSVAYYLLFCSLRIPSR